MVTSSAFAEGKIEIDCIPGGYDSLGSWQIKDDTDLSSSECQTGKFTSNFIAIEGIANNFKFGIDYGNGTDNFKSGDIITSNCKYDFNLMEYRLGTRVLNYERVKLDLMVSDLQIQLKNSNDKINQNGVMLGCDVDLLISEKVSLDGYLGYSLFGATYEENGTDYDPAFLLALKARLNYAVSEHVALSLGLRGTYCAVGDYDKSSIEDLWRGVGGFLIGARYTF